MMCSPSPHCCQNHVDSFVPVYARHIDLSSVFSTEKAQSREETDIKELDEKYSLTFLTQFGHDVLLHVSVSARD